MLALGLRDDGAVEREIELARAAAARAALKALDGEGASDVTLVMSGSCAKDHGAARQRHRRRWKIG